jgi:murein DD-endopeptidase MepM/ murein hydrolase activator NlpD
LHDRIAEWYTSAVPRHRRRPGLRRYLLLAALGAIALSGVGSIVAGTFLAPPPAGAVEGIVEAPAVPTASGPAPPPALVSATVDQGARTRTASSLDSLDRGAPPPGPPSPSELSGYRWPVLHGRVTLPFGPSPWGSRVVGGELFHDGLDLATFCGDRVVAAHDGVVLAASRHYDTVMGWVGDLQPYLDRLEAKSLWSTLPIVVVIDDGNGYRSMYAHLSKAIVKKGQTVSAGELIGYEGKTGRASGCHLHYGLFSPLERAKFGIDPGVVERMLLPAWEIARVDPLLVLPDRTVHQPAAESPAAEPAGSAGSSVPD